MRIINNENKKKQLSNLFAIKLRNLQFIVSSYSRYLLNYILSKLYIKFKLNFNFKSVI